MHNSTIRYDELFYQLALTLIENIGPVTARKLITHLGSAEQVFKEKFKNLILIEGIGNILAKSIMEADVFKRAEQELAFIEKNSIQTYFFQEEKYPVRLKQCWDSPILLFAKGTMDLNPEKVVSIVGTRKASKEGKKFTEKLISGLKNHNVTIISGLAYGIDITAHRCAYENNLQTIGVLAHGLDTVYPSVHKKDAKMFAENGGVLSDFPSGTKPDRERFPSRNRIVAGLSDATIVIESKYKGGSIITADIAGSYNRDVFAVPGAPGNEKSEGCNRLIKTNKAALVDSVEDIEYLLGWDKKSSVKAVQQKLFLDLNEKEQGITEKLNNSGTLSIDELSLSVRMPVSELSMHLLNLEISGVIESLPGKKYRMS